MTNASPCCLAAFNVKCLGFSSRSYDQIHRVFTKCLLLADARYASFEQLICCPFDCCGWQFERMSLEAVLKSCLQSKTNSSLKTILLYLVIPRLQSYLRE